MLNLIFLVLSAIRTSVWTVSPPGHKPMWTQVAVGWRSFRRQVAQTPVLGPNFHTVSIRRRAFARASQETRMG